MEYDTEDLSWLTQKSPESKPNFDLLSESEDDITIDESNVGADGSCPQEYSNISIEDFHVSNGHCSTQISEDISSDDDLDNM